MNEPSKKAEEVENGTCSLTPQSKQSHEENFPVGSFLISSQLRPHVLAFYALARATDDIADSTDLTPDEKIRRLESFEKALLAKKKHGENSSVVCDMVKSSKTTGVSIEYSLDLIKAFKQDVYKKRYDTWSDLIQYCNMSAAPVGRFLLDLHREGHLNYGNSDALCNALQVLNHLQDLRDDYLALGRVYLPMTWIHECNAEIEDLGAASSTKALRLVINKCLDCCEDLVCKAKNLPLTLKNRRLAMETAVIISLAIQLIRVMRVRDPLCQSVKLRKTDFIMCMIKGVFVGLFRTNSLRRKF